MDQHFITRIVEAALLASTEPLSLAKLHSLFPEDQPAPADSVEHALETLREACTDRGVELVELASGFRYQVQADVHPWVARLWTERQTRYTRATLETLALIAYRQPITRGEIEQVRGVAVSSNTIRALEEREWIRVVGHRDVPGKPALFGTTKTFLDYFGLKRLDELPPLSELKDLGELEPQFAFDGAQTPVKPIATASIASDIASTDAGNDDEPVADGSETDLPASHDHESGPAPSAGDDQDPETAPGERAADATASDDPRSETTVQPDEGPDPAADTHADEPANVADEQIPNDTDDTETASSEQQK